MHIANNLFKCALQYIEQRCRYDKTNLQTCRKINLTVSTEYQYNILQLETNKAYYVKIYSLHKIQEHINLTLTVLSFHKKGHENTVV